VLLLLRVLRFGPRSSAAGAMLALIGFVVLAGPEPSVLRAGVMGAVGLLALAAGRARAALPALGVAVIVLVLWDPDMAVSFGFALSVLATGGLVLIAPRWADRLAGRGVPRGLAEALAVPAAAHLVTAPVVAGMAGEVSVVAVLANLLAAPVVAPATVLGVLAALVAPVAPWLAELFVRVAGPALDWLIIVARHAARVPGASIAWPSGWWGGLLLAGLTVVVVAALDSDKVVMGQDCRSDGPVRHGERAPAGVGLSPRCPGLSPWSSCRWSHDRGRSGALRGWLGARFEPGPRLPPV